MWLGPGFLWMVSAAGSGELLFTPRIGALHGYALVWALLAAVALKWFVNREIGRYAVCTGRPLVAGMPRWALLLILVPQLVVAVAAIAGLAGSAATALVLVLPGDIRIWMVVSVGAATAVVTLGRYRVVERVAAVISVLLAVAATIAAISVRPDPSAIAAGLVPSIPDDANHRDILPWLGFMLSGAAGMMWYSHWVVSKKYGAASGERDPAKLRGWVRQMTFDTTVAVVGTTVVTLAFLVLGAELLRPRGLVPEEQEVASVLGELLGGVWGRAGFWFMILAVFVGFWDTVLSDQDGHGRLFASGARRVWPQLDEEKLRVAIVIVLVTILPIAVFLAIGQPVTLLALAGAIEAAHIPIVAVLTLALNRKLPRELRPSWPSIAGAAIAAGFFAVFAALYLFS